MMQDAGQAASVTARQPPMKAIALRSRRAFRCTAVCQLISSMTVSVIYSEEGRFCFFAPQNQNLHTQRRSIQPRLSSRQYVHKTGSAGVPIRSIQWTIQ